MQFWWYTSFSETWGWHHGCISGNVSWFEQTTQTIHFYTFFAPGRTDKVSLELRFRLGKESLVSDCQWVIGYHLVIQHSHEKSPFFIGKPSINGPFSMAMLKNQRVFSKMCWIFLLHSWGRSTLHGTSPHAAGNLFAGQFGGFWPKSKWIWCRVGRHRQCHGHGSHGTMKDIVLPGSKARSPRPSWVLRRHLLPALQAAPAYTPRNPLSSKVPQHCSKEQKIFRKSWMITYLTSYH